MGSKEITELNKAYEKSLFLITKIRKFYLEEIKAASSGKIEIIKNLDPNRCRCQEDMADLLIQIGVLNKNRNALKVKHDDGVESLRIFENVKEELEKIIGLARESQKKVSGLKDCAFEEVQLLQTIRRSYSKMVNNQNIKGVLIDQEG